MPKAILKTDREVLMLLTLRNVMSRKPCPVAARVVARLEIACAIADALSEGV